MKLEVKVDEADVGLVHEGQSASFSVDAYPGKAFAAKIVRVNVGSNNAAGTSTTTSASSSSVVSYGAVLAVSNPDFALRPGMTATATISTSVAVSQVSESKCTCGGVAGFPDVGRGAFRISVDDGSADAAGDQLGLPITRDPSDA